MAQQNSLMEVVFLFLLCPKENMGTIWEEKTLSWSYHTYILLSLCVYLHNNSSSLKMYVKMFPDSDYIPIILNH